LKRVQKRKKADVTMIEHTEARYDVQEVEMGKVYRWCPEGVVVECDCGEKASLTTTSKTTCGRCGADHEAAAREGLVGGRLGDEALHPWHYDVN
jgi:uncharacterized low-complexity protein